MTKLARSKRHVTAKPLILAVLSALATLVVCQGLAAANPQVPGYAVEVGHHHGDRNSWSLWLYGNHEGRQCWSTEVVEASLPQRSVTCGLSVPKDPWQLAAVGVVGQGALRESVVFLISRPGIASLRTTLEGVGRNDGRRLTVPVQLVGTKRARAAHLARPVGVAVVRVRGVVTGVSAVRPEGR